MVFVFFVSKVFLDVDWELAGDIVGVSEHRVDISLSKAQRMYVTHINIIGFLRVPGCPRVGGSWGTLRIPFGKIGEP